MAIAFRIAKAAYDALPDVLKSEYEADGDEYKLDLTGIDLKAQDKLDGERSRRRAAERAQREAEAALQAAQDADDRPTLIANHDKALKKEKDRGDAAETKLTNYVVGKEKDTAARTVANSLSRQNAHILLPHVAARITVDTSDISNPKVVVIDSKGVATDKTLEDLGKEFLADKNFSGIVQSSQATGGGASKAGGTGGRGIPAQPGNPPPQGQPRPRLSDMSPAQVAERMAPVWQAQGLPALE